MFRFKNTVSNATRTGRRSVRKRQRRMLASGIESLQSRQLMAADFGLEFVGPIPNDVLAQVSTVPGINNVSSGGQTSAAEVQVDWNDTMIRIVGADLDLRPDYVHLTYNESTEFMRIEVRTYGDAGQTSSRFYFKNMRGIDGFQKIDFQGRGGDDTFINDTPFKSYASGGAGNDRLYGGSGDDILWASYGEDIVYGRGGDDWLEGGSANDTLVGGEGDDYIVGGTGDDIMIGGSGDDLMVGQQGKDIMLGQSGQDVMHGSMRSPSYMGYENADDDVVMGGSGNDRLYGGRGNDTLNGGRGEDVIIGREGNDSLHGGSGDDWLDGGIGRDTLKGQDGNDQLFGRDGRDVLHGGNGDDLLDGGDDMIRDKLFGGAGADLYVRHLHIWTDDPDRLDDWDYFSGDRRHNDWWGNDFGNLNQIPDNQDPDRRW